MPRLFCLLLPLALALPSQAAQPPEVVLSAGHQKLCKVRAGDQFPELEFAAADGKPHALREHYGASATVVAVVGKPYWATRQLLNDLPRDVTAAYGKRGVRAVAVFAGPKPKPSQADAGYVQLTDTGGKQIAKLGSGRLPRVYVLGPRGKLLWFDIEYSRSTRRDLKRTLEAIANTQ